jgi:hypothetical protein
MILLATDDNPLVAGEKPDPYRYQFLQDNGSPINLTNYQVKFNIRESWSPPGATLSAALDDAPNGWVIYTFTGAEFPTPGRYYMEFWVGNGNQRYCSEQAMAPVRCPVGFVPAI